MKRRRLNEDDLELWRRVTERTEKLELNKLFTPEIDAPPLPRRRFGAPRSPCRATSRSLT